MELDDITAQEIVKREELDAKLREVSNDALLKAMAYVKTIADETTAVGMERIIEYAGTTGNYYTAYYLLQAIEENIQMLRVKFGGLIFKASQQGAVAQA